MTLPSLSGSTTPVSENGGNNINSSIASGYDNVALVVTSDLDEITYMTGSSETIISQRKSIHKLLYHCTPHHEAQGHNSYTHAHPQIFIPMCGILINTVIRIIVQHA